MSASPSPASVSDRDPISASDRAKGKGAAKRARAPLGRAPVKLLSDVPEVRPQAAPRPAPLALKTASESDLLAHIARLADAGQMPRAEEAAWAFVKRTNPALSLGKKPRAAGERAALYRVLARALMGDRNHLLAAAQAEKALAADPHDAEAHMLRAAALRQGGRWEDAVPAARAALAESPDLAPSLAVLLDSLMDLGRVAEAEEAARQTLRDHGRAFPLVRLAAGLLARRGRLEDAGTAFDTAAGLAPTAVQAAEMLARKGHMLTAHGQPDAALAAYRAALGRSRTLAAAWAGVIACLHALDDEAGACREREAAEKAVPGFTGGHLDFWFPTDALAPLAEGDAAGPLDPTRALLVNGVGVLPAIPLGVTSIKGYVEANSPFRATVVDLNAQHFALSIGALRRQETAFDFDRREAMDAAFAAMETNAAAFAEPESFKALAPDLALGFSLVERTFKAQLNRAHVGQGPIPWWVGAYTRHLLTARAAVVGFSITFTDQLAFSVQCARLLKAWRPDTVIIFGGGFFKNSNLEGFLAEPFVDAVILNEGEAAFLAALEAVRDGAPLADVPGVARHDPETGAVTVRTNTFDIPQESLPYADFSDLDHGSYLAPAPVYPVISSRGCYWRRCTFCNHFASYANSYKAQGIERLVDELEHHARAGVRHFTFVDEMISAKRFKKIAEEILARNLDIRFYALAKPTNDFTAEILELMRQAGCLCIYWGMESGAERILKMMDKGNDAAGSARTLRMAADAGIRNHVFLIVGFPSETREDLRETVDFLYANRDVIDTTVAGNFVLEMGTPAHDHHTRFGIRRVYPERALADCRLVDYEIEGAINQRQAERYAAVLRAAFLDKLSAFGPFFGTPRDHTIAIYDRNPDLPFPPKKDVPHPDSIWSLLDNQTYGAEDPTTFAIAPRWRPVAGSPMTKVADGC